MDCPVCKGKVLLIGGPYPKPSVKMAPFYKDGVMHFHPYPKKFKAVCSNNHRLIVIKSARTCCPEPTKIILED